MDTRVPSVRFYPLGCHLSSWGVGSILADSTTGFEVGPGINASLNVLYADYDTDGGDADGVLDIVGLTYSF